MLKKFLLIFCILIPTFSFAGNIILENNDPYRTQINGLSLTADSLNSDIGGFRFVLAIEEKIFTVLNISPGSYIDSCNWEYLTWRSYNQKDLNYSISPATSLLEIYGLASLNGNSSSCGTILTKKELLKIEILKVVADGTNLLDRTIMPIPFYWRDCQDNIIYSKNLDTVYTVSEHYHNSQYGNPELINANFPGYGINGANCDTVSEYHSITNLSLTNSWLEIPCVGIDGYVGDLNLNGVRYEVADMVLYANYFIYGIHVFTVNTDGQIYNSDINIDGLSLSISDLVYGIKILTGTALIYWKNGINLLMNETQLSTSNNNSKLSINSTNQLDAVYLKFVTDNGNVLAQDNFSYLPESAELGSIDDTTTMLMVNFDGTPVLDAGENILFESINTNYRITYFEAVDIYGQTSIDFGNTQVPQSFELFQNYPNPFNPTTSIKANLSEYSKWSLDIVSITGQTIRTYQGAAQGLISIEWDGKDKAGNALASGVYLYRFRADGQRASKKMLLLK